MSKQLISDSVKASSVQQIGMELYNSSVYMYIAAYLNSKGLKNLAEHFEDQVKEEQSHAFMIYRTLTDLGVDFDMPPIEGCAMPFTTMMDVAELYLQREIETTNSLKEIRQQAADETEGGCPVMEMLMTDMLKLQQAELDEAGTFYDKVEVLENDWKFISLWDSSLDED